jgi:hypothetical protein
MAVHESVNPPTEERPSGRTWEGSQESRRNSLRDGCRSRVVCPDPMQQKIDRKTAELRVELKPRSGMELLLIVEIARATAQVNECRLQADLDNERTHVDFELAWDDVQKKHVYPIAEKLSRSPTRTAQLLEMTRQGAHWCLEMWKGLLLAVEANACLTDKQRKYCFDLLGIDPILRDGTAVVPACDDAAGLRVFLTANVQRLEELIEKVLVDRDARARHYALRGLPPVQDKETRRVTTNLARAEKRLQWAIDSFRQARAEGPLAVVIDPETRQPVGPKGPDAAPAPGPPSEPAPKPDQRPKAGPAAAGGSGAPRSSDDDFLPPLSPKLSKDDREMFLVVGEHFRQMFRQVHDKLTGDDPPQRAGGPPGDAAPTGREPNG